MVISHLKLGIKLFCGVIKRGKKRKKIIVVKSEVICGLLWDIFVTIENLINGQNNILNNYVD